MEEAIRNLIRRMEDLCTNLEVVADEIGNISRNIREIDESEEFENTDPSVIEEAEATASEAADQVYTARQELETGIDHLNELFKKIAVINKNELKDLIRDGYSKGIVRIVNAPADTGCCGIVCNIGIGYFYFDEPDTEEYDNAEEYVKATDTDKIIDSVYEAVIGIYKDIDDCKDGEAMYYYRYLKSKLKE